MINEDKDLEDLSLPPISVRNGGDDYMCPSSNPGSTMGENWDGNREAETTT